MNTMRFSKQQVPLAKKHTGSNEEFGVVSIGQGLEINDGVLSNPHQGPGLTLVDDIGISTTDVMHQDAVSKQLYGKFSSGNYSKNMIQIGNNSNTVATGLIVSPSISIGTGATSNSESGGDISIGYSSRVFGSGGIAIGRSSLIDNNTQNSIAIGRNSRVTNCSNSVALGINSVADKTNTISVGNELLKRNIVNVADPVDDYDAVNLKTLNDRFKTEEQGTYFSSVISIEPTRQSLSSSNLRIREAIQKEITMWKSSGNNLNKLLEFKESTIKVTTRVNKEFNIICAFGPVGTMGISSYWTTEENTLMVLEASGMIKTSTTLTPIGQVNNFTYFTPFKSNAFNSGLSLSSNYNRGLNNPQLTNTCNIAWYIIPVHQGDPMSAIHDLWLVMMLEYSRAGTIPIDTTFNIGITLWR